MKTFHVENVRGYYVVSSSSGRIVGVHNTMSKARAQLAAIANKRANQPRRSRA